MEFDTSTPIWVQLTAEFSRRIVVAEWPAGARLPGVRELAADLGVNPNTVQRALAELDREGLARSERTTGRFVTSDEARIDQLRVELTREAADDFIRRARGFGVRHPQARQLIDERWTLHDDHDPSRTTPGPRGDSDDRH